jgi:hypothetical protein
MDHHERGTLAATRELIERSRNGEQYDDRRQALARVVARYGGPHDLRPLVDAFLAQPSVGDLLRPIRALGDRAVGEELWNGCDLACVLSEEVHEDVLWTVGYLGFDGAQESLLEVASTPHDGGWGHPVQREAALGLLNLPCAGLEQEIAARIRGLDRGIFAEHLPALAFKTGDLDMLDEIYDLGRNVSSSFNSGVILGLALFGAPARARFFELLFDEFWEANAGSTGTRGFTYQGARLLRIGIVEVYEEVKRRLGRLRDRPLRQCFMILEALLELRLRSPEPLIRDMPPEEPLDAIHHALFDWGPDPNKDASIQHWLASVPRDDGEMFVDGFYELDRQLDRRLEVEAELEQLRLLLGISPSATS